MIDVLDVVEDDDSVRRFVRAQVVQTACDDLLLSWLVARANSELLGEFDQVALD